jgi:hypothetical protein
MINYKPEIYTKKYFENKYLVIFYLNKKVGINLTKKIHEYYIEYATGFALFKRKKYIIENHSIEPIIKFLSLYCKNTSNKTFNKILEKINNTPNIQKIDLLECFTFLIKYINYSLINNSNFENLLYLIHDLITKLNIYAYSQIHFICSKKENNKYISQEIIRIYGIVLEYNDINNTLENIIIKRSLYKLGKYSNLYYEKSLIITNKIFTIIIQREAFNNIGHLFVVSTYIKIPKILDLPDFVFFTKKEIYELIGVVIYDLNTKNYPMIIKQNNKFFYYFNNQIIEINNKTFDVITGCRSHMLFYKIL